MDADRSIRLSAANPLPIWRKIAYGAGDSGFSLGSVPFGVAFVLMWLVPPANEQALLAMYYTAMYVVFDTTFTLVNVPYIALTPELAPSYDERTSLHSYRMAFSIGLGLAGAIAPPATPDAVAG